MNNFAHLIILPLIGGRIFYVFEHFSVFRKNLFQIIAVWDGKFSAFGIFFTAIFLIYIFSRRENEDFWGWLDAFSLSGLVGLIFIHAGHFFSGAHYGRPTDLPWGISFDAINIPFINPIHPVQIYSAILTLIILSLAIRTAKKTHLTGVSGNLAIMIYCVSAFAIDFLRGAPSMYIKINHILIAAFAFIFYIHCSHKKLFS